MCVWINEQMQTNTVLSLPHVQRSESFKVYLKERPPGRSVESIMQQYLRERSMATQHPRSCMWWHDPAIPRYSDLTQAQYTASMHRFKTQTETTETESDISVYTSKCLPQFSETIQCLLEPLVWFWAVRF